MPKIIVTFEMNTEDFDDDMIDLDDSTGLSNLGFEHMTDQLSEHGDNITFKLDTSARPPQIGGGPKKKPGAGWGDFHQPHPWS